MLVLTSLSPSIGKIGIRLFWWWENRKKLTHCNIYLSNVLHTVTVYNTAFNTQQNKSISYKIKWEGRKLWCLGLVSLVFITSQLLLFKLSVQDSYFICRCIIQSHQTDWGKEQEYGWMLWAWTSMSADSHVLPFPVWGLEVKRILMTTDQTGMKPPAVRELIDNAAIGCSSVTSFPINPAVNPDLAGFCTNNQATINRAINSYCNTLIYSIIQGSSVVTSSIYMNTIYTHARAHAVYSTNMHTGDAAVMLNCTNTHSCVWFSGLSMNLWAFLPILYIT